MKKFVVMFWAAALGTAALQMLHAGDDPSPQFYNFPHGPAAPNVTLTDYDDVVFSNRRDGSLAPPGVPQDRNAVFDGTKVEVKFSQEDVPVGELRDPLTNINSEFWEQVYGVGASFSGWGAALATFPGSQCTFYVPASYDGSKPYGLLVYTRSAYPPDYDLIELCQQENLIYGEYATEEPLQGFEKVFLAAAALKQFNIDRKRVYITGGSVGGQKACEIFMRNPFLFSGALPYSGSRYFDPDALFTQVYRSAPFLNAKDILRNRRMAILSSNLDGVAGDYTNAVYTNGYIQRISGVPSGLFVTNGMGHVQEDILVLRKGIDFLDQTDYPVVLDHFSDGSLAVNPDYGSGYVNMSTGSSKVTETNGALTLIPEGGDPAALRTEDSFLFNNRTVTYIRFKYKLDAASGGYNQIFDATVGSGRYQLVFSITSKTSKTAQVTMQLVDAGSGNEPAQTQSLLKQSFTTYQGDDDWLAVELRFQRGEWFLNFDQALPVANPRVGTNGNNYQVKSRAWGAQRTIETLRGIFHLELPPDALTKLTLSARALTAGLGSVPVMIKDLQITDGRSNQVFNVAQAAVDATHDTLSVSLKTKPRGTIVVDLANWIPDPAKKVTISPASLTFTPENYATSQEVTIAHAVNENYTVDLIARGDSSSLVTSTTEFASSSPAADTVPARQVDNVSYSLTEKPSAPVTLHLWNDVPDKVWDVSNDILIFTPENYDQPQSIQVTSISQPYSLTPVVSSEEDLRFAHARHRVIFPKPAPNDDAPFISRHLSDQSAVVGQNSLDVDISGVFSNLDNTAITNSVVLAKWYADKLDAEPNPVFSTALEGNTLHLNFTGTVSGPCRTIIQGTSLSGKSVQEEFILNVNPLIAVIRAETVPTVPYTTVLFDGMGSKSSTGTITGYTWDFGDGTAKMTGPTTLHTYAEPGEYLVELTVEDDQPRHQPASAYQMVAVGERSDIATWRASNGLPQDGSGSGAFQATPAGDGIPNLVKYGLGISANTPGYQDHYLVGTADVDGESYQCLTYTRPEPAPTGVSYFPEACSNLTNNSWSGEGLVEVSSTVADGERTIVVRDANPIASSGTRFLRLRVTTP